MHVHNFHFQQTLYSHPNNPALLIREVVRTFLVKAYHLRSPAPFEFKLLHEIVIASVPTLAEKDFVLDFDARFGNKHFNINDVIVEKAMSGNLPVLRFKFNAPIEVKDEIDVRIYYHVAALKGDNVSVALARYPTLGFQVSLQYS